MLLLNNSLKSIKRCIGWAPNRLAKKIANETHATKILIAQGALAAKQLSSVNKIETLADVEFSIFSQWGEDGIIEWLVQRFPGIPEQFVEFGVENYTESNTRFLMIHRNWSGLVIDADGDNISYIESDPVFWRHDLQAVKSFITCNNINELIAEAGFAKDIGILSVDIDGMDYWVWQAINQVSPWIVIIEYNAVYGNRLALVTPHDESFVRTAAHSSNLYYGASIAAIKQLGEKKGYTLVGTNTAGNNAFLVRDDLAGKLIRVIESTAPRCSRFREARDPKGRLTHPRNECRSEIIADCIVQDVETGCESALGSFEQLYDEDWR